ncbi:hypothetical protein TNCV_1366821 [Trichonephila clavipes]|nr:hypothetical protein TNCV_1366821 [Trichonephila clavipes]
MTKPATNRYLEHSSTMDTYMLSNTRTNDNPKEINVYDLQSHCNVASPNINSGRRLCLTRHPHVHLAAAAQPLFDPRGIEHRRPEDERGEML